MIARYGDTDYGYSEAGYGYGVRSFRGVFDGLTLTASFLGAWSFSRRLWSNVNVPLFRARRATDSTERDWFGTGPQGEVNITEFQSWCSGGDAFAVTLYDQSGLARNFAQATTTIQPILAESGTAITENGRLAAKFVAADARRMSIPSSTAMFNALHTTGGTVLAVSRANDTALFKSIVTSVNAAGTDVGLTYGFNGNESSVVQVGNGSAVVMNTATTVTGWLTQEIKSLLIDPDNAVQADRLATWRNGASLVSTDAGAASVVVSNAAGNFTLGARANGTNPFDGTISEVATFSALISTADRTAWQSRSGNFYGVPIA